MVATSSTDMPAPQVSVLLPVYNAEAFLEEAIASILNQTVRDFELLVFDDGSTDASGKLLADLAANDNRIRVFTGPNRGLLAVLQLGLDQARSHFLARMDADDIAAPDRLEKQLKFLHENLECVAVGSRVMRIDPDGDPLGLAPVSLDHDSIDNELLNNLPGKICHPTVMMRTQSVRDVGGYQQEYHLEDVDLFLRLAEVGKLANLDEPLLRYRLHGSSICHTRQQERIDEIYQTVFRKARERRGESLMVSQPASKAADRNVDGQGDSQAFKEALENACHWSSAALDGGFRRTAWKHAFRAIKVHPTATKSWWAISCCLIGRGMTDGLVATMGKAKRMILGSEKEQGLRHNQPEQKAGSQ